VFFSSYTTLGLFWGVIWMFGAVARRQTSKLHP
jgi:hypothetical protein